MNTLLQPKTHIAKVRQRNSTVAEQVQSILEWSHQDYCNHQFEQYELFLEKMFEGYPVMLQQVRYSPVFRGFWNNEWALRNEFDFIPFTRGCESGDADLIDEYLFINNHMALMNSEIFMMKYNNIIRHI